MGQVKQQAKDALLTHGGAVQLGSRGGTGALHPVATLEFLLERERALADRHGHGFSLLVYDIPRAAAPQEVVHHLTRAAAARIRTTDVAGWLEDGRIGILLPFTAEAGARKLAADLATRMPENAPRAEFLIYTYPEGPEGEPGRREISARDEAAGSALASGTELPCQRQAVLHRDGPAGGEPAGGRGTRGDVLPLAELLVRPTPRWKRTLDVLGATLGILLLTPLWLAVILIIRTTSRGPAFFRQQRAGFLGRPFTMWKFRTMKTNADPRQHQRYVSDLVGTDQALQKLNLDAHLIPCGGWLRRLCIDELPQLINVLQGTMSLVGPRPDVVPIAQYRPWHKRRFDVVPGMTGLWQVSGKNRTTFHEMIRLDIAYARRRSPGLDMKILFWTLPAMLRQLGEE